MNMNTIIRAQLFEYLNNPNIHGNTVQDNLGQPTGWQRMKDNCKMA